MDLEALVNDMNGSLESLYSGFGMQSETVPLLESSQQASSEPAGPRSPPQASPRQKVQRSQPVHILAARYDPAPPLTWEKVMSQERAAVLAAFN